MSLFVYILVSRYELEDMAIYLNANDAISASLRHPRDRVEIFMDRGYGYVPTYNYYENGKVIYGSRIRVCI
jgi:hypothetical protein